MDGKSRRALLQSGLATLCTLVTSKVLAAEGAPAAAKPTPVFRVGTAAVPAAELASLLARGDNELVLPPGRFVVEVSAGTALTINKPIRIRGAGKEQTIVEFKVTGKVPVVCIEVNTSGVAIEDLTLGVSGPQQHCVILSHLGKTRNHRFSGVRFTSFEDRSSAPAFAHGLMPKDDCELEEVVIERCTFDNLAYPIFTSIKFNGIARNWRILNSNFYGNHADDIEINSSDNPKETWSNIVIQSCTFDRLGIPSSQFSGMGIGIDSGRQILITGNSFANYSREAIHLEDYIAGITVTQNRFINCKIGVMVYQMASESIIVEGNYLTQKALTDPAPAKVDSGTIGIYIANPKVQSSSTIVRVHGNTVTGYDVGIYAPVDRGGEVFDNVLMGCAVGIAIPAGYAMRVRDNRLYKCLVGIRAYKRVSVGRNFFEDCSRVGMTPESYLAFPAGILVSDQIADTAGDVEVDGRQYLATNIPDLLAGKLLVELESAGSGSTLWLELARNENTVYATVVPVSPGKTASPAQVECYSPPAAGKGERRRIFLPKTLLTGRRAPMRLTVSSDSFVSIGG